MRARPVAIVAVVALVVAVASAALALTSPMLRDDGDRRGGWGPAAMRHAGSGPSAVPDQMRAMRGMPHGVRVTSEYQYLAEMVAHHREAVDAARELQRSDRPEMRELGESIVASQTAQIERMEEWLDDWYADRSGEVDYEPMMRDLSGLSGDRLDRAFLQDMLGHHMGAVMASQQLLVRDLAEHPEVAALARTIRDEQHAEIWQMQRWLAEWFGQSGHGGMGHGMRR